MKFMHIILVGLLLAACAPSPGQMTATALEAEAQTLTAAPTPTITPTMTPDPVLVGAGDIADCNSRGDEATASLLDNIPGTIFTTGDNVYEAGTASEFRDCYEPTWGRHKERTRPSAGNHDYVITDAAGYFDYFGPAAGDPGKGYYSYDLGAWHIIVLNSNIPVRAGSPQEQWLRKDLAAHPAVCTAAYWHFPFFSSGIVHGNNEAMRPLWQALYEYGADVVLNGHEHNYERFALQNPLGEADPLRGIRQFVVGTGGRSRYELGNPIANSEVGNSDTFGVLKLTLHADSYSWEFIPEEGKTFTDTGRAPCVTSETDQVIATVEPDQRLVFTPVDDATVKASTPDENYGSATTIETDSDPVKGFLLKFVVSGIDEQIIESAVLRLYNLGSSEQGGVIHRVADNSWNESTLTWNTLPIVEPGILGSLGSVNVDAWYEIDLTPIIIGNGTYSLQVNSSSTDGADYSSKEGDPEFTPRLVITVK